MTRRNISVIADVNESVKQLEQEIRALTTQKQSLQTNVKDLENQRDRLLIETDSLATKIVKIEKEAKDEADRILKIAQGKMDKANLKEGEIAEQQSQLKDKIKEADNLIKSNEGLQKNLNSQNVLAEDKLKKINALIDLIKENSNNI